MASPRAVVLVLSLIASAFLTAVAVAAPYVWPHGPWLGWLGWVGLVPLFVSIRFLAPWRAMTCGVCWGVCLYLFLGGFNPAITSTAGSLPLLATAPALYVYAAARFTRRFGFSPLFLGLGWIVVELALSPLGLRSGLLSGTQGHGYLVDWASGLLGSGLVAFVVAAGNATLLLVAGHVRFKFGGSWFHVAVEEREGSFPQTLSYCSSLSVRVARPRAPPM